jgi:hypothetical protein
MGLLMDRFSTLYLPMAVLRDTVGFLRAKGKEGHEGALLWLGTYHGTRAVVVEVYFPVQTPIVSDQGLGYFVDGDDLFRLSKYLFEHGLRLLAQVHSHPDDAYHSEADDLFAIASEENCLSLVVPSFGRRGSVEGWAVHRLVDGAWVRLSAECWKKMLKVEDIDARTGD